MLKNAKAALHFKVWKLLLYEQLKKPYFRNCYMYHGSQ